MDLQDKPRLLTLLLGMAELYSHRLSEMALELYCNALMPYALDDVQRAIDAHMRNPDAGQYWPKPADLLRQIGGGTTKDRAAVAWAKVERELRRVGAYASVVFDDPLIMRGIADLGGWPALCHTALDELPFRAKDFKALYAASAVAPATAHPRALPGLAEQHNRASGLPVAPPVLVGGDPAAALAVYRTGQDLDALAPPHRPPAADWPRLAGPPEPVAAPPPDSLAAPAPTPPVAAWDPATVAAAAGQAPAGLHALIRSSAPPPDLAPRHLAPPGPSPDEQDHLLAAARARYRAAPADAGPVWTPPVEEEATA